VSSTPPCEKRTQPWRFLFYAALAVTVLLWLDILGILKLGHHYPPEGTTTIDQLVADHPNTFKFAIVAEAGRTYVVWVGRPPGVLVSGPPVYVFDETGSLVDRVGNSGDSDNQFVGKLHASACLAPEITPREALAYCLKRRAMPSRRPGRSPNPAIGPPSPRPTPGADSGIE